MKKTFIFDIDGTLFTSSWKIHPESIKAIEEIIAQGHQFILASGRPVPSLQDIANKMLPEHLKPIFLIGSNGMTVFDYKAQKVVNNNSVPLNFIKEIIKEKDVVKSKLIFQTSRIQFTYNLNQDDYKKINDLNLGPTKAIDYKDIGHLHDVSLFTLFRWRETNLWNKHYAWVEKLVQKYNLQILKMTIYDFIDILPKGNSKGDALRWIAQEGYIDQNHCYSFGDGINDIEMLQWSKESYAMIEALDITKAAATEVIGSNDSDTIAQKVYQILKTK